MAVKRLREVPGLDPDPPAKRSKVNTSLAKIWEQLANESEEVRLEAAADLLQNHLSSHDVETSRTIAKRLFRGLCSSRKAARLGFYMTLIGALSAKTGPFGSQDFQLNEILSILEAQTTPESGTSGQDERDHNFGRLMGCKAILDSGIMFNSNEEYRAECDRLFSTLCNLVAEKPWLRPEFTLILASAIRAVARISTPDNSKATTWSTSLFKELRVHKLLRTIDSVGLWILTKDLISTTDFPRDVWTKNDPLNIKDTRDLKRVLLDRKSKVSDEDEVLGDSGWSPVLHVAWQIILNNVSNSKLKARVSFSQFWQDVVEDGLFRPSSTPERKHTGLLVFQTALEQVGEQDVASCFSPNVIATLVHSLMKKGETYLFNTARNVMSRVQMRAVSNTSRAHETILGLVEGSNYIDFDTVTKSTILNDLLCSVEIEQNKSIDKLTSWIEVPPPQKGKTMEVESMRKNLLNICQRAICCCIRKAEKREDAIARAQQWEQILKMLQRLLIVKRDAIARTLLLPFQTPTIDFLKEKITSIVEALLATGSYGEWLFLRLPTVLRHKPLHAENDIKLIVEQSWLSFEKMAQNSFQEDKPEANGTLSGRNPRYKMQNTFREGFALLFSLLLQDVYDGDGNSTEILEDVLSAAEEFETKNDLAKSTSQITEVVISLVSRPSRLFRRAGGLIFEAFSKHMSSDSLKSLCDVLLSEENREGQQELFEADASDYDENLEEDGRDDLHEDSASDGEELDSDVEVIDKDDEDENEGSQSDETENDPNSASDAESGSSEPDEGDENEELMKFENALAKALGTRKLNQDDVIDMDENSEVSETSGSDADMSDSGMMELDDKLTELFRNQQSQLSIQRIRRDEMKSAKQSVIDLKNRALELIEIFLRLEQKRGAECVNLVATVFEMAAMTKSQQIRTRGVKIIQSFARRCRGSKLPNVDQDDETRASLSSSLVRLHACLVPNESPNRLSNALVEAASLLNVLLCRLLETAGDTDVVGKVNGASSFRKFGKADGRQASNNFWTQFDQWVASSGQMAVLDRNQTSTRSTEANGTKSKDESITKPAKTKMKNNNREKRKSK